MGKKLYDYVALHTLKNISVAILTSAIFEWKNWSNSRFVAETVTKMDKMLSKIIKNTTNIKVVVYLFFFFLVWLRIYKFFRWILHQIGSNWDKLLWNIFSVPDRSPFDFQNSKGFFETLKTPLFLGSQNPVSQALEEDLKKIKLKNKKKMNCKCTFEVKIRENRHFCCQNANVWRNWLYW